MTVVPGAVTVVTVVVAGLVMYRVVVRTLLFQILVVVT